MLTSTLKGIAGLSAAGLLLLGAGSVARADLAPPTAPAGVPVPSQAQGMPGVDSRDTGSGPSTPLRSTSQDTVVSPAPAGGARADVVRVNPLDTCVSCTSADAGGGTAHARSTAVRLLGNNISAGESSGGDHGGALLALPANPLLSLALAGWDSDSIAGATSSAHSRASLLDLAVAPTGGHATGGLITVAVLEATSDAGYQGLSSNGAGSNNGVDANLGNGALVLILLHSDASSANHGSAYVAGINGTQLLGSDQTGANGIPISVPGVIGVVLLKVGATGGAAGTGSAAVGTAGDLLGQSGEAAGVLTASAAGLGGLQAGPNAGNPTVSPSTGATAAGGSSALTAPLTGASLGLGGLLLLATGGGLAGACLRRRRDGLSA